MEEFLMNASGEMLVSMICLSLLCVTAFIALLLCDKGEP